MSPWFLFWFCKHLGPSPLVQTLLDLFLPEHLWAGDVLVTAEVAMKYPLYLDHRIPSLQRVPLPVMPLSFTFSLYCSLSALIQAQLKPHCLREVSLGCLDSSLFLHCILPALPPYPCLRTRLNSSACIPVNKPGSSKKSCHKLPDPCGPPFLICKMGIITLPCQLL